MTVLSAVLGCAQGTNVYYPLHARPDYPLAVTSPEKVWLTCGDDYVCITPKHLDDLREFVVLQNALIEKYEKNIELHNSFVD